LLLTENAEIRIRSTELLRVNFKRVASDFGTYHKAIEAFVTVYNERPDLFARFTKVRRKGIVYG